MVISRNAAGQHHVLPRPDVLDRDALRREEALDLAPPRLVVVLD
jgi:hypothetical protein